MNIELICDDKNCQECNNDDGKLCDFLEVDKLEIKKTSGKSGDVHPDIIKYNKNVEKKQKIIFDQIQKMSEDVKNSIIKFKTDFDLLYEQSNKMDFDCSDFENQYPICKRVWRGDEEPHMKLNSYTYNMEKFEVELDEFMKKFYS